jgi:hypothetical protein
MIGKTQLAQKGLAVLHLPPCDYLETLYRQQGASLAGKEVYFWGCGATYKKYRHLFAEAQVRCILVDLPGTPQSVDGIPVRHPNQLQSSAKKLPVVAFTHELNLSIIAEKLHGQYNFLVEGEPVFVVDVF